MMGIKDGWLGLGQNRRRRGASRTPDEDGGAPNPDDDRPARTRTIGSEASAAPFPRSTVSSRSRRG